ncbi:MAG TPA: hypothetical protein VGE04_16015 [Chloroflexia bacterium]|jgi:hypothetical protein
MSDQGGNSQQGQGQEEGGGGTSSTIPQPEGKDPVGAERTSQAEGDRDTIEADLQDNEGQGEG